MSKDTNDTNAHSGAPVPLNEFVREAILESLRAISDAQEDEGVGALVSPTISGGAKIDPSYGVAYHDGRMFTTMTFDLAVTAQSDSKVGASGEASGGSSFLASFKLGVSAESAQRDVNVNRIKFSVHVELPKAAEN